MPNLTKYVGLVYLIAGLLILGFILYERGKPAGPSPLPEVSPGASLPARLPIPPAVSPSPTSGLVEPVAEFKRRVTKKPFGVYVTSKNSPVQPERFTGYHTGADAEYGDVSADVPVYSVADGVITASKTAAGLGGVIQEKIGLNGAAHTVEYGHIRPGSLPKVGQSFKRGEQIGVLGTGYTVETDGERKHLHFAVLSDDRTDLRGYVASKADLSGWLEPLSLYP